MPSTSFHMVIRSPGATLCNARCNAPATFSFISLSGSNAVQCTSHFFFTRRSLRATLCNAPATSIKTHSWSYAVQYTRRPLYITLCCFLEDYVVLRTSTSCFAPSDKNLYIWVISFLPFTSHNWTHTMRVNKSVRVIASQFVHQRTYGITIHLNPSESFQLSHWVTNLHEHSAKKSKKIHRALPRTKNN